METRLLLAGNLVIGDAGATEGTIANEWTEIRFPVTYYGDAVPGGFTVNWSVLLSGAADDADFPDQFMSGTFAFEVPDQPGSERKDAIILSA